MLFESSRPQMNTSPLVRRSYGSRNRALTKAPLGLLLPHLRWGRAVQVLFRTKKNQYTLCAGFSFLFARWKGLEQGGGAQRCKQSAQCNNDDHSLRLKQGGVVGAAF